MRREPDDVWYEPDMGWVITFALISSKQDGIVMFVVRQPEDGGKAALAFAIEVNGYAETPRLPLVNRHMSDQLEL